MDYINESNFSAIVTLVLVLAFLGWVLAAFIFGQWLGLKAAVKISRNDIVGMNKIEEGLVKTLSPGGVDALNFWGNALLNLAGTILASKVDPEALAALKDYFSAVTDRKPNLPPEPPAEAKG